MTDEILVSVQDTIATITLNRPSQRNAMTYAMWQGLGRVCAELQGNREVRVVVVQGAGDEAFSAGANIKEFEALRSNSAQARLWAQAVDAAMEGLVALSKPVIALIKGYCVGGGCELATFADIRIAADNARLGIPPARLGIALGYREMQRLVQLVGPGRASYILFSARLLDAQEALRIGLVDQVAPLSEIDAYTWKLAQEAAALSPVSHATSKEIIRQVLANPGLQGLTPEQEALPYRVFDSADYQEGRRAFMEKRRPRFQGE